MRSMRALAIAALVVLSLCAVPLSAAGVAGDADRATATPSLAETATDDRPDDPETDETIGYVEGYWYDDELPVDDRDSAVVPEDELDAVVYRSMARVELIRELTFDDDVPVEVITRSEFQDQEDALATDLDQDEAIQENVNQEALFVTDRETSAVDQAETLFGDAVAGFYDPLNDEVVLVSDDDEAAELDEPILGHELLHALQDQQFDLTSYDRETIDGENAELGLIEGDAVVVEETYREGCETGWDCVEPSDSTPDLPADFNWGLYFIVFQPYADGPAYVDDLREQGGWDAVDDAYDDPPASTSEVIRPGDEREPVDVSVTDRSSDGWSQLEIDGERATETVGEAGMVSMFASGAVDDDRPSVIPQSEFISVGFGGEELHYDQPYTDGWAGDELVTYVPDDYDTDAEPTAVADDAGYVWQTEWTSEADAQQFIDGYLQLLDHNGADPVTDRQDTYEIDDGYPGAYFIEQDDETVTIVNAPSVDDLDDIEPEAAPDGDDRLDMSDDADSDDAGSDDDGSDSIAGFGVAIAIVSLLIVTALLRRWHADEV